MNLSQKLFTQSDGKRFAYADEIKKAIEKEADLIENDFMMRVMGRLMSRVHNLELIRDLVRQDFKHLKAERLKIFGEGLSK